MWMCRGRAERDGRRSITLPLSRQLARSKTGSRRCPTTLRLHARRVSENTQAPAQHPPCPSGHVTVTMFSLGTNSFV